MSAEHGQVSDLTVPPDRTKFVSEGELNILVVDDTVVYRRIVSDVVGAIEGTAVVATAPNGKIALDKMRRLDVDLVLLDVEMPEMGGLEMLKVIRRDHPDTGVIMVSGANRTSADITVKALQTGAIDFVPKPDGKNPDDSRRELIGQLRPLVNLFQTRRSLRGIKGRGEIPAAGACVSAKRQPAAKERPAGPAGRVGPRPTRIDIVAIGVSTGGPNALAEMVPRLPADLGKPVLIVQHMPPVFTKSLAEGLNKKSPLSVREACDGETLEPNTILIAPGGRHMVIRSSAAPNGSRRIALNDSPPENGCRPSVDVLFRSVATQFGGNVLATVMTGMGEDGCKGVQAMKRQGCYCLTQAEATCVVYGMPRAVDDAGLSDESVPLNDLAGRIAGIVRNPAA